MSSPDAGFKGAAIALRRFTPSLSVNESPAPTRPSRAGVSGLGELYEYYKRIGALEVFFALFPGG